MFGSRSVVFLAGSGLRKVMFVEKRRHLQHSLHGQNRALPSFGRATTSSLFICSTQSLRGHSFGRHLLVECGPPTKI